MTHYRRGDVVTYQPWSERLPEIGSVIMSRRHYFNGRPGVRVDVDGHRFWTDPSNLTLHATESEATDFVRGHLSETAITSEAVFKRQFREGYDFDLIFDWRPHRLIRGEHYECLTTSMRANIYNAAKRREIRVFTMQETPNRILVQRVGSV